MKLLGDDDLRRIEAHLGGVLDRTLDPGDEPAGSAAPGGRATGRLVGDPDGRSAVSPLRAALVDCVMAGGKRIRPQLALWTWRRCVETDDGDPDGAALSDPPAALLDLACGWELFHAFLLVHDDIIDGADRRRDRPSLHRHLQSLDSDCPRFGVNLGIVAGDLLFSAAMRLWHDADLPPETYRPALQLFGRVAATTGYGQAIDICQGHVPLDEVRELTLLREYHWKTAAYTFEGPMLTAAIVAGADAPARQAIGRYALALGQAYQLQNDLIDLSQPANEGCDLVQGKRTVTLVRARAAMTPADRKSLDARLAEIGTGDGRARPGAVALAESVRLALLAGGAADATAELVEHFLIDAESAALTPALPPRLASGLRDLLAVLRSAYFRLPPA